MQNNKGSLINKHNSFNMKFNTQNIRKKILDMAYAGSAVHIGCAFSIVEILATLYRSHLRYPEGDYSHPSRDYFLLSKGHGIMAQYACIHELGWLHDNDLSNYFSDGTLLKGLADSRVPGVEVTSGSLGHGLSIGVGLAKGAKLRNTDQKIYVVVGDGEINEGSIWEGMLFASHHKLGNIMVIVDENNFQAMGKTQDIMNLGSIESKFKSFGFDARVIDGHDEGVIHKTVLELWSGDKETPKAIIAKTVKGKGVNFMENDNSWHYMRLNEEAYNKSILLLNKG